MQAPTEDEAARLARARELFDGMKAEMLPVLADLTDRLGLADPPPGEPFASAHFEALDRWMASQVVGSDEQGWMLVRAAYLLGAVLVERWGGSWFVDDEVESLTFARVVVGRFARSERDVYVDPFELAAGYVAAPPGRSLGRLVEELEAELRKPPST